MVHNSPRRPVGFFLWLLAGGVGLITLMWLVIVVLPPFFAPRSSFKTMADALKGQNDVRTTLLQGTGALLILASAVAGAYFTWRTLRYTQEQLKLAREGQVTERFTRAVDQLGSKTLEVRLGGIYGLERIARDSEQDCPTIVDILTAYIRTHSPWPPSRPAQIAKDTTEDLPELKKRSPEIQAALTVVGREGGLGFILGSDVNRPFEIDLKGSDLRHADLVKGCLRKADLSRGNLVRVNLGWADVSETKFMWADLGYANLGAAQLYGADLRWANLGKANLRTANLQKANLFKANLQAADLREADLREADLCGSDLRKANLDDAFLEGAKTDGTTVWPRVNWQPAGIEVHVHGSGAWGS